mmetsp:Transcript_7476/g.15018  ORF Transcript_7476/g.15018 Transcript_7476/m.15018 type:complete len:124 (-) Transcript_7476:650-1021(-)
MGDHVSFNGCGTFLGVKHLRLPQLLLLSTLEVTFSEPREDLSAFIETKPGDKVTRSRVRHLGFRWRTIVESNTAYYQGRLNACTFELSLGQSLVGTYSLLDGLNTLHQICTFARALKLSIFAS